MEARTALARRISLVAVVMGLALAWLSGGLAQAIPLQGPGVSGTALLNSGARQNLFGLGTAAVSDPARGETSASAGGAPGPALVAISEIGPNPALPLLYGRAEGTLTYSIAVEGPTGSVPIVVDVVGTAVGSATAGASMVVQARWSLLTTSGSVLASDEIAPGSLTGQFNDGFDEAVPVTIQTNREYRVSLSVDTQAAASSAGSHAAAFASIEPLVDLAPGVDPSLYTLAFSSGVGNLPAPEPMLGAQLAAGLLAMGAMGSHPRLRCGATRSRDARS